MIFRAGVVLFMLQNVHVQMCNLEQLTHVALGNINFG